MQQPGRVERRSVGPPPGHLSHLTTGAKGCLQSDPFLSAGMEAPSPRCERQDRQLDFDFQLCEASGCGARGGGSLIAPAVPSVGNGGARETLAIQSSQQLNPLPRRFWQGGKLFLSCFQAGGRKSWSWGWGRCCGRRRRPTGVVTRSRGELRLQLVTLTLSGGGGQGGGGSRGQARCEEGGGPAGGGVCWPGPSSL